MLGLVPVCVSDVREVDVERGAARQNLVRGGEDLAECLRRGERAVGDGMEMREVDDRANPRQARRDEKNVVEAPDLADPAHDLDTERHGAILRLEPSPELGELLDDLGEGALAGPAEQEAGMEDDWLGARSLGDSRGVVEHPDRHPVLLVALDVSHEAGDGCVHRESDPPATRKRSEPLGPRVIHPEAALEIDLAGRVPSLDQQLDRFLGRLTRRHSGWAEAELSHRWKLAQRPSSDGGPTLFRMPKRPTRIDLLELDIDLRLADLWREAADVQDWNLDVVAAFMRAAYGKGYCDALTEEAPGSLCEDHGYRIPPRRRTATLRNAA
jgi:hypothetical protein